MIFVQTNDAEANELVAFTQGADGTLSRLGAYATGGRGTGKPHLPSQGSVVPSTDGRHVLVANAGSDDVSVFAVAAEAAELVSRERSGGASPTSIAVRGELVYVLDSGGLSGFRLGPRGTLSPIDGSRRPLSSDGADGAQVAFAPDGRTVFVTERGTNRIGSYGVLDDGTLDGPRTHESAGLTPYGFDFTPAGTLVVTEAFGGEVGAAAASSYVPGSDGLAPASSSVRNTRSEVCWAVVTQDGRFAYVTNFGDGTISSYAIAPDGSIALRDAVAASTRIGEKGLRDEALTPDGRFLYALDADSQEIYGWRVQPDGELEAVGAADGLPTTVAGLAAV